MIPTRKFKMLDKVHVCKDMPQSMSHFDSDFDAIIAGDSHASLHKYSLYQIKNNKIVDAKGWYREEQLTLIESNKEENHKMITEYRIQMGIEN